MIGARHVEELRTALAELLGTPVQGGVAFVRCLPSEFVDALADSPVFSIPGWSVSAVIDVAGPRRITADEAVEQRENKADALFFLIDPVRAGAGLDGIYSAAREIGEAELFHAAQDRVRKRLHGKGRFLRAAERQAERLGRRHRLTPLQVFDFLIAVEEIGGGGAIGRLGLWPIAGHSVPQDEDLSLAAAVSQRLLFAPQARAIGDRVRALLLEDDTGTQAAVLERFLREVANRAPLQAVLALEERKELWLGSLRARFSGEALKEIRLVSWRGPKGALTKWSGLASPEEEDGKPRLILDRSAAIKDQARLEVRWTTQPDSLGKGTIQYRVAIMAGEDELAERTIAQKEKSPQKAIFARDDFEELDDDAKFEAVVHVAALGTNAVPMATSEEFVLEFGEVPGKPSAASGRIVRSLVEGMVGISDRATFDEAIRNGHQGRRVSEDRKGYIVWRVEAGRSVRVLRPALIKRVEEEWRLRDGAIGRWIARVRADGSLADQALQFVALKGGTGETGAWQRGVDAARKLAGDLGPFGLLARVHGARWAAGEEYINAWAAAFDSGGPELALHGTIEVQSLSGRCLGLIVTPLHPLRLAWHVAYDQLAAHARYEQGLAASAIPKALKPLDSSYFPFALPGTGAARGFVFADTLGFHAVAMTVDGDPEPKAAVALMAVCLTGARQGLAPSVGAESASVLAREIRHYLDCHRRRTPEGDEGLELLNIQAWRPGDGMTVARALGQVLQRPAPDEEEEERDSSLCFTLDLVHSPVHLQTSGRFLREVSRRRRAGGSVPEPADRWMTETVQRPGDIILPRLRWAQRDEEESLRPAHLSLAFDVFSSRLETRPLSTLGENRPLHAFGLAKAMERQVRLAGDPEWIVFAPPRVEGEKAPDNRAGTDRLLRLDTAIARATARYLGGSVEDWPVLATRLPSGDRERIDRLHDCSDWVVTVDRNACVEYFDAPRDLPHVYERFVIDAVPERADLGALQLVTTTGQLDEVRDLVDDGLGDMGLESGDENTRFLLTHLKALSGRLAIRLASPTAHAGELVALALVQAHCAAPDDGTGTWLDLREGFFIPIDEISDFPAASALVTSGDGREDPARSDLIYVCAPPRRPLEFRFVNVQHRLHLKTARQPELLQQMLRWTGGVRRRWHEAFFSPDLRPVESSLRRSQLARILRFYAERAARHGLSDDAQKRLKREIDQLVLKESYRPGDVERPDVGYVLCPEHPAGDPEMLYATGGETAHLWLFGPSVLSNGAASPRAAGTLPESGACGDRPAVGPSSPEAPSDRQSSGGDEHVAGTDVVLGTAIGGSDEVTWRVSIRANPHLMVVGLPGMGKTTCLINICRQLADAGINPIVFAYHQDIEARLRDAVGELCLVDYNGLGFNPLRIDALSPIAHIDVAGALRDIFAAIFPDLGDLQLEELRQAIKQSYGDLGWNDPLEASGHRPLPPFRAFFEILSARTRPNPGLLARLRELADYRFFDASGERASLLEADRPTVVRVYRTSNDVVQRAFASFILYSLYKDMFRRGEQARITHAIVLDEAHRAARLHLIPQFAKECRKFGLAFALASQEARDFDESVFSAIASYLLLRLVEADARKLARMTGAARDESRTVDRMKSLDRYTGLYFTEGRQGPVAVRLLS